MAKRRAMAQRTPDGAAKPIANDKPNVCKKGATKPPHLADAMDAAAHDWHVAQTKAIRQDLKGKTHMEKKNMNIEDLYSYAVERAGVNGAAAAALQESLTELQAKYEELQSVPSGRRADPLYSAGQSVLQWWSNWFSKGGDAPKQYNKKNRPSWFSGEVANPAVFVEDYKYAGMLYTGWAYPTH